MDELKPTKTRCEKIFSYRVFSVGELLTPLFVVPPSGGIRSAEFRLKPVLQTRSQTHQHPFPVASVGVMPIQNSHAQLAAVVFTEPPLNRTSLAKTRYNRLSVRFDAQQTSRLDSIQHEF